MVCGFCDKVVKGKSNIANVPCVRCYNSVFCPFIQCATCLKVKRYTRYSYGHVMRYKVLRGIKVECASCVQSGSRNGFSGRRHSEGTRETLSKKAMLRDLNPGFVAYQGKATNNKSLYDCWLKKYGKDAAESRLNDFKRKQSVIQSGRGNKMYGKPSPGGSGVGWKGWYNGSFFRSLRELGAMLYLLNNRDWETAESKIYTVHYSGFNGAARTYRADFIVDKSEVWECKPFKLWNTPQVVLKSNAARAFFESIGMSYRLVDPPVPDKSELIKLTDSGCINWSGDYESKVREYVK